MDTFEDSFIDPSLSEQKTFKDLLTKFLNLDVEKKDVSGILETFEKPSITTFPCNKDDHNELVVNVVETRLAGFSVPEDHPGGVVLGGTYSWQCKITTNIDRTITMDCDNTIKLNPDVLKAQDRDPRIQEIENLVILYHEFLHGQLMLDAIKSSDEWRDDVCNKTINDKIDYSYSDKNHEIINPLQADFTQQLVEDKGGMFIVKEILPEDTENGFFTEVVLNRIENPDFKSGIKVTYRILNIENADVLFPGENVIIKGNLRDMTQPGTAWLFFFTNDEQQPITTQSIPQWIKQNANWWSQGTITDSDFLLGIEFLIQNGIMEIDATTKNTSNNQEIPVWIRNNALWWSTGQIPDADFISGIKYLIEAGIISYQ